MSVTHFGWTGLHDFQSSDPDGAERRTDFEFDERGFLACRRTRAVLNSTSGSDRDAVVAFTADARGLVARLVLTRGWRGDAQLRAAAPTRLP